MKSEDTTQHTMASMHQSDLAEITVIPRESPPEGPPGDPQEVPRECPQPME